MMGSVLWEVLAGGRALPAELPELAAPTVGVWFELLELSPVPPVVSGGAKTLGLPKVLGNLSSSSSVQPVGELIGPSRDRLEDRLDSLGDPWY